MTADITSYTAQMVTALKNIDSIQAKRIVQLIENEYSDSTYAIEQVLVQALEQIGVEWEEGSTALSQVYMSGIIVESLITQYFKRERTVHTQKTKIGIVTIEDQHTLGKKLVSLMLFAQGFQIIDLGQGLSPEQIAESVREHGIEILLVSCLMLPAALRVRKLKSLLGDSTKVLVGGAPFRLNPQLWKDVGADGFGATASDAATIIKEVTHNG
jgi:methanogenic corrinoid protein MtbC1